MAKSSVANSLTKVSSSAGSGIVAATLPDRSRTLRDVDPPRENQTPTFSPILLSGAPYGVAIRQANFLLPFGLQSPAYGRHGSKVLLFGGRTNGLHTFVRGGHNFPANQQNTNVVVVDLVAKTVRTRSLSDPSSRLTPQEGDWLSATNQQCHQVGDVLYVAGGYGVDRETQTYGTKPVLTAARVSGLIRWVENPQRAKRSARRHLRFVRDELFRVAGGEMTQLAPHEPFLLVFGNDFDGEYMGAKPATQVYTRQVRRFRVLDSGLAPRCREPGEPRARRPNRRLRVELLEPLAPESPLYRRRDFNAAPVVVERPESWRRRRRRRKRSGETAERCGEGKDAALALVQFSGVFTEKNGAWTVPVEISASGVPSTVAAPTDATFRQGMNNYTCALATFYSRSRRTTFTTFFGGISGETYDCARRRYVVDPTLEFSGQCTTVSTSTSTSSSSEVKHGGTRRHAQYYAGDPFPVLRSNGARLQFGSNAVFVPDPLLDPASFMYAAAHDVYDLDALEALVRRKRRVRIGYVIGGIQAVPRTTSGGSPYVFEVFLTRPPRAPDT